jgi:hypothetical protein
VNSDALRSSELVPAGGGTWSGLLFDNPVLGLAPSLTYSFLFPYAEVLRDHGSSPVSLEVDWVELAAPSWRDMAGRTVRSPRFAEPAEASVYFFQHHQYETVDLTVLEQRGAAIHVAVTVSGDLQGLGLPSLAADDWLTFTGFEVSLSAAAAASTRLAEFTDVTGLTGTDGTTPATLRYRPASPGLI